MSNDQIANYVKLFGGRINDAVNDSDVEMVVRDFLKALFYKKEDILSEYSTSDNYDYIKLDETETLRPYIRLPYRITRVMFAGDQDRIDQDNIMFGDDEENNYGREIDYSSDYSSDEY